MLLISVAVACAQDVVSKQRMLELVPVMAESLRAPTEYVAKALSDAFTILQEEAAAGLTLSFVHTCR